MKNLRRWVASSWASSERAQRADHRGVRITYVACFGARSSCRRGVHDVADNFFCFGPAASQVRPPAKIKIPKNPWHQCSSDTRPTSPKAWRVHNASSCRPIMDESLHLLLHSVLFIRTFSKIQPRCSYFSDKNSLKCSYLVLGLSLHVLSFYEAKHKYFFQITS